MLYFLIQLCPCFPLEKHCYSWLQGWLHNTMRCQFFPHQPWMHLITAFSLIMRARMKTGWRWRTHVMHGYFCWLTLATVGNMVFLGKEWPFQVFGWLPPVLADTRDWWVQKRQACLCWGMGLEHQGITSTAEVPHEGFATDHCRQEEGH